MWIFTTKGFFSVVKKNPADKFLTIRSRVRADLEAVSVEIPEMSAIETSTGTDYPFRARVPAPAFGRWMASQAENIQYSNFKRAVFVNQGPEREKVYHNVWADLLPLEHLRR